jgi:PH (Pleckstrin Homology) domain-containing protein
MVQPHPETIRLDGAPQSSGAGNLCGLLVVGWAVFVLAVTSAVATSAPAEPPLTSEGIGILAIVAAVGPVVFYLWSGSFAGRAVARLAIFRWMFTDPQPGASLDPQGLELRSPTFGTRRFDWDEVAGMEPSIAWMRGSFVTGWPDLVLTAPDGRVLLKVPARVYQHLKREGSGGRRTEPWTLAEYVVAVRPDRYVLIDTHPGGRHYWFELASVAADRKLAALAAELGQLAASSGT